MSKNESKGLIHLSYIEDPIVFPSYKKNLNINKDDIIINKDDNIKIFVQSNAYPFIFDGVIYQILKAARKIRNSDDYFLQYFASLLLYVSYDKSQENPTMYSVDDEFIKNNDKFIDYEYFVKFDVYKIKTTTRIDKKKVKGITRDIFDWEPISIKALTYTHLLLNDDIVTPYAYKHGPCSTCLLQPTCLYTEIDEVEKNIYTYANKPCDSYLDVVEEEKKNILNFIPKDVIEYVKF